MRKYCKAYYLRRLRKFKDWTENPKNVRKEKKITDGKEIETQRELTDDDFLYIHENYVVTDGIFSDQNVIFDKVTEEWKEFCKKELNFEVPDFENDEQSTETDQSD